MLRKTYGADRILLTHASGLRVSPNGMNGDVPALNSRPVLGEGLRGTHRVTAAGSLEYPPDSGFCLTPTGTPPGNNTPLIYVNRCDGPEQAFEMTARGSLRHVASGKCIHPFGGAAKPTPGTELVLYSGCDEERLRFTHAPFQ